jgi:hypothetical protein
MTLPGENIDGPLRYRMSHAFSKRNGLSSNARRLALGFVNAIEIYRACWRGFWAVHETEQQMPNPRYTWKPPPLWTSEDGGRFEPDRRWIEIAAELPQFSAECWKQWADVAWQVVLAVSPEGRPEENAVLCRGPNKICELRRVRIERNFSTKPGQPAKILRNSPSIARNDLKDAFFSAFQEVATGRSRRQLERLLPDIGTEKR